MITTLLKDGASVPKAQEWSGRERRGSLPELGAFSWDQYVVS
jgi:hypothetical protein